MKHFIIIFLYLFMISRVCSGQYGSLGFRVGFGTYYMSELSDFQDFRKISTTLPLKTTECYPITPNYRIEWVRNSDHYVSKWGVFYVFNSTGARSTLSDYSGRMDLDAVINGNQTGITLEHPIHKWNKLEFGAYGEGSFIWSTLKLTDYLSFVSPPYSESQKATFKSYGICIEPGIYIQYYILKHIRVRTNLGILKDFSQNFHLQDHKLMTLSYNVLSYNFPVEPQWTGLRLEFQIDI
jgi:hypothetical protein